METGDHRGVGTIISRERKGLGVDISLEQNDHIEKK